MPRPAARAGGRRAAIAVPAVLAGVLFLLSLGFISIVFDAQNLPTVEIADVPAILAFLVPATMIGFVLALVPLILGVTFMAWLGSWNEVARLSVVWLLAGAAMPALLVLSHGVAIEGPGIALILTGALCALLARRYVRWTDSL